MKLSFHQRHLSIADFPETVLPKFTLLTGANGVGKTHLLRAIQRGDVKCEQAPDPKNDIRLYDWTNLVPRDTDPFDSHNLTAERAAEIKAFEDVVTRHINAVADIARSNGLTGELSTDIARLVRLSRQDLRSIEPDDTKAQSILQRVGAVVENMNKKLIERSELKRYRRDIERVAALKGKFAIELTAADFESVELPSWGEADIFQNSLSRLFVAYRDLRLRNYVKLAAIQQGRTDVTALSEEEFQAQYLAPPWTKLNETLRQIGLDFEVNSPDEFGQGPFQAVLRKKSSDTVIKFSDLSSGEKVMISLTLCAYYAQDRRQIAKHPKVLLLDEVDAPLHPSMTRTLINVIRETLVGTYGIEVILATHSPSTVALAPDESIFVMTLAQPGISSTSKAEALNLLTDGVPTLAISFDGRRQVFAESQIDAEIYDTAYQAIRPSLGSERSLEFIGTGVKADSGGDAHTGCQVVKHLVTSLTDAGNISALGVIDWDGENDPSDRVYVLAHRSRDGLENLMLDPLLLSCVALRDVQQHAKAIGFAREDTYVDFLNWRPEKLQTVVDRVQDLVLSPRDSADEQVSVEYFGGFSLKVSKRYLQTDDHELEASVEKAFPGLRQISKGRRGQLMLHIANLIRECPQFLPIEIVTLFRQLLS
jgi:energy-coupling factor transporter ATP-binding protein EcfA2